VALVTGASRGTGRGIAEVFVDEGAHVVINDIDMTAAGEVVDDVKSKGRKAVALKADVARRAEVEPMFEQAWRDVGPTDVLANHAGIETIVPFLDLTDEQWTALT